MLEFKDLAVEHGFANASQYDVRWFHFDNARGTLSPISSATSRAVPAEWTTVEDGRYLAASLSRQADNARAVTVYLRKNNGALRIVGVERTAKPSGP
jgi:hypothetical protein